MAESEIREPGVGILEDSRDSIEAKRNKIKFRRAERDATNATFGDSGNTTSRPRRSRTPKPEQQTQVTIGDSRSEVAQKVRGKAPKLPAEEEEEKKPRGRGPARRKYPTIEDSSNTARFLLSAVEIAAVTASGPQGEMTDWERGILQAPLQRIIARTPIGIVEKGGIFIDIGFLTVGFGVYLTRVTRGLKMPDWAGKNRAKVETQEDTQAPIGARPDTIVNNVKPGDVDGLAVPIPNVITANMNGAI
jgi:ribosomal protein S30